MRFATSLAGGLAIAGAAVALAVSDASACHICDYDEGRCVKGNYYECDTHCIMAEEAQCWCHDWWTGCAWVRNDVLPDGALLAQDEVELKRVTDSAGNTRWVSCSGVIVTREYNDSALERIQAETSSIVI